MQRKLGMSLKEMRMAGLQYLMLCFWGESP
ncbi:MAG: hypothetical protein PWP75_1058, partial [Caldanaerobacter sp.]|nr:hypothetical protein [Caldanaerobacter sp.]